MVAKTSPWRFGNATRINRNCCEGIRKIRFTFKLNKYQQDKKYDTCWQIASRFQFLIILSEWAIPENIHTIPRTALRISEGEGGFTIMEF